MRVFTAGIRTLLFLMLCAVTPLYCIDHDQPPSSATSAPRVELGAEIWIEPGQSAENIDLWFKLLAEAHMPVARLFLSWNVIETAPNVWDWRLYDEAFRAAEKYHVRIAATLTVQDRPAFRGRPMQSQGARIIGTEAEKREGETYIAQVVERYKSSPALDSWLLMNEPGQHEYSSPLAMEHFRIWSRQKYGTIENLNAAWKTTYQSFEDIQSEPKPPEDGFAWPVAQLDWATFTREYLAQYLGWIAGQVRAHDPDHGIHVNPHALVGNLAAVGDDLPTWRPFLSSMGASIHPAWHFGLLSRDDYALGVAYVTDLIHGAIEPKPYWVTELQGGNNIFSANRPMNPTSADIAQWVWTAVGGGVDRVIFWLLNARAQGGEAGEWSLLDFQNRPSERLQAASQIGHILESNRDFFDHAHALQANIAILLSPETMAFENLYQTGNDPARGDAAHVLSALGIYREFTRLGIPVRIKHINDYEWGATDAEHRMVILPHVLVLTASEQDRMAQFVHDGGTVLATGLTGLYDEHARFWPFMPERWNEIFGARLKEVRLVAQQAQTSATDGAGHAFTLPARNWIGEIDPMGAEVIGRQGSWVTATRFHYGKGTAIWLPSTIGMGAWFGDGQPLSEFLSSLAAPFSAALPVRFPVRQQACVLRTLTDDKGAYVTVVTNGSEQEQSCPVVAPGGFEGTALWNKAGKTIGPRETLVTRWKKRAAKTVASPE